MRKSKLQKNPKSKMVKRGYINIYSKLSPQELRQHFYKTLYKKQNPKWDESQVYLANTLKKYLKPKSMLLDIGCGNGNYLIDENRKSISWATGIDPDKNATRKNQCLDEIVIGSVNKMPFGNGEFDVAISLWVFEHLENPQKAFSEVRRVLKEGGMLLFVAPNYNYLPLKITGVLNKLKLNHFLNKELFGREAEDVFETYYKASTVEQIEKLTNGKFEKIILKTNFDPSYTSFNSLTYKITDYSNKLFSKLGLSVTHPHLIGVLKKV